MVDTSQPKNNRSPVPATPQAKEVVASPVRVLPRGTAARGERRPDPRLVRGVVWDEV